MKYDLDLDKYVRDNVGDIAARFSKNSKFVNSAMLVPDFLQ